MLHWVHIYETLRWFDWVHIYETLWWCDLFGGCVMDWIRAHLNWTSLWEAQPYSEWFKNFPHNCTINPTMIHFLWFISRAPLCASTNFPIKKSGQGRSVFHSNDTQHFLSLTQLNQMLTWASECKHNAWKLKLTIIAF